MDNRIAYVTPVILKDEIRIRTSPARIFGFFQNMEAQYTTWHPDHVLFRWIEGHGVKKGVAFYFEEYINGELLKKTVRFTRVIPDQHIEFAPTSRFVRLFLPRMIFAIKPDGDTCLFRAEIHLRMGPLAAWLNRKDIQGVRRHMKEEGENLKTLLEGP